MQIVADGTPGGGTTNVLALCEDLVAEGVQVVFCSQKSSYALARAMELGVHDVVDGVDFFRGRIDSRVSTMLRRILSDFRPDIIHAHGGRAGLGVLRASNVNQRDRMIYTVRGYQFYRKPWPLRSLAKLAERRISRSVFRTVHVSQNDQRVAIENGFLPDSTCSVVIRNGLRISDILQRGLQTLGDGSIDPQPFKEIAILGRLTQPKNPHLVLDIARALREDGFKFHWIGSGDMHDEITGRATREKIDNITFHGGQSREKGLALLAKCGTLLMPSLWEGLPLAPVEAMAAGVAVVVSDIPGNREVVRDGIDGRVVQGGTIEDYCRTLKQVVSSLESTKAMIDSGRRRVEQEFTRDRVVRQHLELYRECLDQQIASGRGSEP